MNKKIWQSSRCNCRYAFRIYYLSTVICIWKGSTQRWKIEKNLKRCQEQLLTTNLWHQLDVYPNNKTTVNYYTLDNFSIFDISGCRDFLCGYFGFSSELAIKSCCWHRVMFISTSFSFFHLCVGPFQQFALNKANNYQMSICSYYYLDNILHLLIIIIFWIIILSLQNF